MFFRERIIVLWKHLQLSQDNQAKQIGTSAPVISRYDLNEIKPSIKAMTKIADELNNTVDDRICSSYKMVLDKI